MTEDCENQKATKLKCTPLEEIPLVVSKCRSEFLAGANFSLDQRKNMIRAVLRMIDENEDALCRSVHTDLRKHHDETMLLELTVVRSEAYHFINHLDEYASPEKPSMEGIFFFENCEIRRDPLGVVLIIGAWNYPIQLVLLPLLGALAAGNSIIIKPSEMAPATATVLQELFSQYLPEGIVGVVNGGVVETTQLLKERFDHILYTGNSRVAEIVMTAAAKHLTPVTLELGGKSPAIVDASCKDNMEVVARRIMWGKVVNAGQTCVAPDYVMVQKHLEPKLIESLKVVREELMGGKPLKSREEQSDYPAIVNAIHFNRLTGLLKGGTVVVGGEVDEVSRTIAPTVLSNVQLDHQIMEDEIFGPLLPLLTFENVDEVINFVNLREKPLALYIFSKDAHFISKVVDNTSSGGVLVNDVIIHAGAPGLPFGGVGRSGMGMYHGKYTFDTFSHKKSVMRRQIGMESFNMPRYPPYVSSKTKLCRRVLNATGERSAISRRLWFFTMIPKFVTLLYQYVSFVMSSTPSASAARDGGK